MLIWLTISGEPKPGDAPFVRLLRMGMLAHHLAEAGHEVVWWSSDFDHVLKVHRYGRDIERQIAPNLKLRLLHGCGYRRHVSLARLRDHRQVASAFTRLAPSAPKPDVVVAAYPTIELAAACAAYANPRGIPVAMDIRDLWPDIFLDLLPWFMRPIAKLPLLPYRRFARRTLARADALLSVTEPMLNWGLGMAGRSRNSDDHVIPFGYSKFADDAVKEAAASFWREKGLDSGRQFIVCLFATFGRQFDIDTIVDSARLLENRNVKDVRFVLCGQGDNLEKFRKRAAGLETVLFPGYMDSAQIAALMSISRLGLAPYFSSRNFVMHVPNKPIEYMSAGLPILTCLEGLLSDMLRKQGLGYIYRSGVPESLVSAVLSAKANASELSMMGERCRALFEKEYMAGHVMEIYRAAIEKLASRHCKGREPRV